MEIILQDKMKKFLFLFILFFTTIGYSQTTESIQTRKIGYTTNYGYGIHTSVNQSQINQYNLSRTATPYTNKNVYIPGASQPRRITVYNGSGGTAETPGGDSDSSDWLYMYDESTGIWYCSKDGGVTWYEYRSTNGFGEWLIAFLTGQPTGSTWRSVDTPPSDNATHFAPDPDDPFLEPIGDFPIEFLMCLIMIYVLYKSSLRDKISGVFGFKRLNRM